MGEVKFAALGFLAASVISPMWLAIMAPLGDRLSFESATATLVVVYPFSAAAVLAFGVPAFLLLRPFRPGTWWAVLAVGFLLGIGVAFALREGTFNPHDVLTTGPLAAASSLVFWLIWKQGTHMSVRPRPSEP